jgi:DNA helicase II / ATP-dependent DNA helicase PcrA
MFASPTHQISRENVYRFSKDGKAVDIRVGSIHSVKGETHTGTLVMETFWYGHSLEALLPWLSGDESGGTAAVQRQQLRPKIHYVAMTRPTHLLCLAMKRNIPPNASTGLNEAMMDKLTQRRWKLTTV